MPRIRLNLPGGSGLDRSYDILVRPGAIGEIGPTLSGLGVRRTVILVDAAIQATHGSAVAVAIGGSGIACSTIVVPSGETSKSVAEAARIWESMALEAVDRKTHVLAVGGGVVGDLAGFVAASFARGLPCWQVPTTLVAQVDSAIGGKTGVNLAAGKNLVGAFWQPRGVFCDIGVLATLPEREFVSGLAEVVKYGMILDADFFDWLERNVDPILARDASALTTVVERSAAIKAQVVEQDEREQTGLRAALNYGHTFGHAIETASGYGSLLHGEAVAIGMHCAARLAESVGRIGPDVVDRQRKLLEAFRLPAVRRTFGGSPDALIAIMLRDKKTVDGMLRFVLPSGIGRVELVAGVDAAAVRRVLS
jgi:3-dehydroquinate synthase